MKNYLLTLFVLLTFVLTSVGQEGMWLLTQIDNLNLEEKGLQIETTDIYNPDQPALYNAIIQLGGGTASFVSPDGLIITNHHVAFGALQRAASAENDYLTNGFLARNRVDEIEAPGYEARSLIEMEDVTSEILKAAKGIDDPLERDKKINAKIAKITDAIEKKADDIQARVTAMYNGKQYILFVYKVFKDIRIVYAPPSSIGKYGGDIDNWMWPRHTGDFSFLRVYCTPEGNGAGFSEDNVPYKPKVWLKAAQEDLKDGDFTFIMGYPGTTTRYRTSNSANWNLKYNYPFSIDNFATIIELMDDLTKDDLEGKIKVAGMRAGLANAMKNYQGKVDGMTNTNYVGDKIEYEKKFADWVNSDPLRKEKYGNILSDIKAEYKVLYKTKDRDNVLGYIQGLAGTELGVASYAFMIAKEMDKPKKERNPRINESLIENIKAGMQYQYANLYEPLDKELLAMGLNMANELQGNQRIVALDYILNDKSRTIDEYVDWAYSTSKLNDLEFARSLFGKTVDELVAMNDPFINIIANIEPVVEESNKASEIFAVNIIDLRKIYIDALYDWKGTNMYPDANSTIRFTSGPVKGYVPADAVWYNPFTSLTGVIDKDKNVEPFDAPDGLTELYKNKDFGQWVDPELNDVPVAFLHQCDITGGNSGSPVMNAKGEIIGVAFDGNYEAMISDWQYDLEKQRTISVDMRYVLFVTEKFGDAGFILEEMGVPSVGY